VAILALKLTLTPILIAVASVVQHRRGALAGGILAGLPLTSAPVSVFLALEHGPAFASAAAIGTLLGVVAMSTFCAVYAVSARRVRWPYALLLASTACAAVTWLVSLAPQRLDLAAVIVLPALVALIVVIGSPQPGARPLEPVWWDTPARMAVAALAVVVITAAADLVGPTWSGLLATLPVFAAVMGVFSHRHAGPAAAHAVLRGIAVGALGAAAFFFTAAALLEHAALLVAYAVAVSAALGAAAASGVVFGKPRVRDGA
jgi:hypothetical protein